MQHDANETRPDRRALLLAGLGAGTLMAGEAAAASKAKPMPPLGRERRDAMTPADVVAAMLEGNRRFLEGEQRDRDFLAEMRSTSTGQYPAACVVSCVDSRAAVEVICDLGLGDTFNARVAGNVINEDVLGSAEFACALSGAKLVVVMGHTNCGAIKGAIDGAVLGNLTLLLARIREAVDSTKYDGDRTSANKKFVDAVAQTHVKLAVAAIRGRSPVLAAMERDGKIGVIGAMYDLASGEIRIIEGLAVG
jgi:carbonic anhydrase